MAELVDRQAVAAPLRNMAEALAASPDLAPVLDALQNHQAATVDGVVGSASGLVAAAIAGRHPLVVLCASTADADRLIDDCGTFSPVPVQRFPAWQSHIREELVYDATYGERLRILKSLVQPSDGGILVASVQSVLQPVPSPEAVCRNTRAVQVGDDIPMDALAAWLVARGFHSVSGVELPGEFARRGGILDLFAADWDAPVRLEWLGDAIESIRSFDLGTQRSMDVLPRVEITVPPPREDRAPAAPLADRATLFQHVSTESRLILVEPEQIRGHAQHLAEHAASSGVGESSETLPMWSFREVLRSLAHLGRAELSAFAAERHPVAIQLRTETVERLKGSMDHVRSELEQVPDDRNVMMVCSTAAEVRRLSDVLKSTRPAVAQRLEFAEGRLHRGFHWVDGGWIVLSASECFSREEIRRTRRRHLGKQIDSFIELKEGELVVHLSHGIGRFRGMQILRRESQVEEHLVIEFAAGTRIFVPSTRIGLVQKYVGGKHARPRLATIGGVQWQLRRKAAESAVHDLASDLLDVQAQRSARPGIACSEDSVWQREFDGSFPYEETDDQLDAIEAIKRDMQQPRPMDRLLCGDVGFGKTEVAIRAAFKAVDNGYQVAILVPTTVLAEQHFHTFSQRMAEYPVTIARLSRFCTSQEERRILDDLGRGIVDIVIGTHRLASQDIHFQNLGLLVIDEEQRFGVEVKERLKSLRSTIDVLTMTATPIPRTLHMSLTGMRDISNLEQAPAERTAVETRLSRWDDDLIRRAILRELDRGGQVYFVHNRIADIDQLQRRLVGLVPEAEIRVGHGRMAEHDLEQVMLDFVAGRFDVLLATTIVESGLDIPNANTIFIDEAQRYGLADLHQLRGRVGRYNRLAYCYLLVDPRRHVTPEAARRLRSIEEFSHMGAGFAIAMRDLEFRGAGNVLGAQQSGHIAAVGYEHYCELLEAAVRRLQSLPPKLHADVNIDLPGTAFLPDEYVSDQRTKIDLYRRLTRIATQADLQEIVRELEDRFGPPPAPTQHLLAVTELRLEAAVWQLESIHFEKKDQVGYLVLRYTDSSRIRQLASRSPGPVRIVDERTAYYPLSREATAPEEIIQSALRLFRDAGTASKRGYPKGVC